MSKLFKNLFHLSIAVVAVAVMLWSCKKSDISPAQQLPKITALSVPSAIGGTMITIKGVNLKNVDAVKFGTTAAVGFDSTANTDSIIHVIVPDSLPLGPTYIQVYLANGGGYSAYAFTVLLTPPVPKISSVTPTKALPGTSIAIVGVNFTNVNSVTFNGIAASFSPGLDTDARLNVIVPMTASGGNQYIRVSNLNGADSIQFNVDRSPAISSVSSVKVNVGDVDTVHGYRFTGATAVSLGSSATTYTVINDSTISFTVPTGASTGFVTVTTPIGSGATNYNVVVSVAGLKLVIYDDAVGAGFGIWGGWGGTADFSNTEQVESGAKSIKVMYVGGYGSPVQLGGASIDLTQYSTFKISIYGGTGVSAGNKINIVFNETGGIIKTLNPGVWNDFEIPISDITSATTLTEIWLQEFSGVDETVYIDNMGLN